MIFCMPFDFHWKREKERAKWRSYNISIQWRFVLLLELIEHTSFIIFYSICDRSLSLYVRNVSITESTIRATHSMKCQLQQLFHSRSTKSFMHLIFRWSFRAVNHFFCYYVEIKLIEYVSIPFHIKFKEMETVKKLKCPPNCEEMYFWSRFISFIRPNSRNQYYLVNFQIIQSKHALLGKGFRHSIGKRVSSSEINNSRNEHLVSPSDVRGWKNHI